MTFSVTDKEIRRGLKGSYTHNPISLVIKATVKKELGLDVKVEIYTLDYGFIDGRIFDLPHQCRVMIRKFHSGEKVQGIVFDLDLPEDFGRAF